MSDRDFETRIDRDAEPGHFLRSMAEWLARHWEEEFNAAINPEQEPNKEQE